MQDVVGTRKISTYHTDLAKYIIVKKYLRSSLEGKTAIHTILMPLPEPLTAGQKAPTFSYTEHGRTISSTEITSPHLIYFYPKDNTPGCNKEACAIRDRWADFKAAGLKVVGVSQDSDASHHKFTEKFSLPFPLIADTELALAKAFGVYGEKKFMGRTYDGIHRMSFLIATDGTILKNYPKVKPEAHAAQVLEDLSQLTS